MAVIMIVIIIVIIIVIMIVIIIIVITVPAVAAISAVPRSLNRLFRDPYLIHTVIFFINQLNTARGNRYILPSGSGHCIYDFRHINKYSCRKDTVPVYIDYAGNLHL